MTTSGTLDALLFDLDDTLVSSAHLADARRSRDHAAVRAALPALRSPVGLSDVLTAAQSRYLLGVVTSSPQWYAEQVLSHLFPRVRWDAIVCADGVERPKPYPDALQDAARELGAAHPERVAYVGDSRDDVEAAYHARMRPVVCTWINKDADALQLCPDAVLDDSEDLARFLDDPREFLPLIEGELVGAPEWRQREITLPVHGSLFTVNVLGRYFPLQGDTLDLHKAHPLSRQIFRKREAVFPIPEPWIEALRYFVLDLVEHRQLSGVTVIPAKPGRDPRMERLLELLAARVADEAEQVAWLPDLLEFTESATTVKYSGVTERYRSIAESLRVARRSPAKTVLLLDDVLTTGGSLAIAEGLLRSSGATRVISAAIAKTVSASTFRVTPARKLCPECGRLMVQRVNGRTGDAFYGCTGFKLRKCSYTESI